MNNRSVSTTRERNLFDPASSEPYRLSRSKIELFLGCARCFHLDRRLGISRPDSINMSLNTAVDVLLKREFDLYRQRGVPHEAMLQQGIDALPLRHPALDEWRDVARGIRWLHPETSFLVHGAIDDLWIGKDNRMIVVDYKATSTERTLGIGGPWTASYQRQVEVYQWLLRRLGYDVSETAYFVFANADRGRPSFDGRLEFTTTVIPYVGSDAWIEDALKEARICLCRDTPPAASPNCSWCQYRQAAASVDVQR